MNIIYLITEFCDSFWMNFHKDSFYILQESGEARECSYFCALYV